MAGFAAHLSRDEIGLLCAASRQRTQPRARQFVQGRIRLRIDFGAVTVLDLAGLPRYDGRAEARPSIKHRVTPGAVVAPGGGAPVLHVRA